MNWVGGARSRLKAPNERKVQREYFERKRLATRVSRGQKLNQLKAPISKDLLFLSKAASNAKMDSQDKSLARPAPRRLSLDSCGKLPVRDLELPMSPIEKPSCLDLMDTTVASNLSLDQSLFHPVADTASLPKVSTMKLPRGPQDIESKSGTNVMDVSCMTERLFPISKPVEEKEPVDDDNFTVKRKQPNKKYSLDDLLNASRIKESFFPKNPVYQKSKHNPMRSRPAPKHADELLWSKHGMAMLRDGNRKRPNASDDSNKCILSESKPTKQKNSGYNFGEWMAHTKSFKSTTRDHNSKLEVVCDGDSMLEIHYAPKQEERKSIYEDERNFQLNDTERPAPRARKDCQPKKTFSSLLLTENPFSDYHQPSKEKPTISEKKHKALDESIIGPIMRNQKAVNDQRKKNTTSFERMMISFEDENSGTKSSIDAEDVTVGLDTEKIFCHEIRPKRSINLKQDSDWKDFVSGEVIKSKREAVNQVCESKPPKLPKLLKSRKTMNCSVLEELMSLEEETLKGLDTCTQELTFSPLNCSEDPVMRRVPDMADKLSQVVCSFDERQESLFTTKSQTHLNEAQGSSHSEQRELEQALPFPYPQEQLIFNLEQKPEYIVEVHTQEEEEQTNSQRSASAIQLTENDRSVALSTQTSSTAPSLRDQEQQTSPLTLPGSALPFDLPTNTHAATPNKNRPVQMYKETAMIPNDSSAQSASGTDGENAVRDASVQAGLNRIDEVAALTSEVNKLKEELKVAESTIIWQSLMMRIQNI